MAIFNIEEKFLLSITKNSKNRQIDKLKQYFNGVLKNKIVRYIEERNTPALLVIFKARQGLRIVKAEINSPPETTTKEIQWYRALDNINNITPHFYGGTYNNHIAMYELEFLQSHSLLEDIFIRNILSHQQIKNYLTQSIEILFEFFYSKPIWDAPLKEAEEVYWKKILHRTDEAIRNSWLKDLLSQEMIVINSKEYLGIPSIMEHLSKKDFRKKFTPKKLGFIHGDLHFGNILVNGSSIKLIDPNGRMGLPIEYDLGKLLHFFHGLYNHIHRKKFSLSFDKINNAYSFQINYNNDYWKNPQTLFPDSVSDKMYIEALFSECCHFLTMLPHHIRDRNETTALYLRTLELFQYFFRLIKS